MSLDISVESLNTSNQSRNSNDNEEKEILESHQMKILVKDTGLGMSQELINNLSKPFKKESNDLNKKHKNEFGSGLGLSIVHEMALVLVSGVQYETKLGEGTSFWFNIPIKIPEIVKEISNEVIFNLESNSCVDYDVHDILDPNKIDCNIQNDQSNSGFTLKSFSTRKINDLYFQKPIGIYSDYNIASFSDDMIDNIFVNSQRN